MKERVILCIAVLLAFCSIVALEELPSSMWWSTAFIAGLMASNLRDITIVEKARKNSPEENDEGFLFGIIFIAGMGVCFLILAPWMASWKSDNAFLDGIALGVAGPFMATLILTVAIAVPLAMLEGVLSFFAEFAKALYEVATAVYRFGVRSKTFLLRT